MAYFASTGATSDQAYEAGQAHPIASAAAPDMPPGNPALTQNTRPNNTMTRTHNPMPAENYATVSSASTETDATVSSASTETDATVSSASTHLL